MFPEDKCTNQAKQRLRSENQGGFLLVSKSCCCQSRAMLRVHHAFIALTLVIAASGKLDAQDAGSQLIVSTVPTGLQVRVDGEARGLSPVRVGALLPGTHLVEALLASGELVTRVVELGANSSLVVELSAEIAPPATAGTVAQLTPPPSPAAPAVAPAPPTQPGVRLRLESDPDGLRLNFDAGSSMHHAGNVLLAINSWNPVCSAPCEQRVEPGHYRAAISDLDGDFYPVRGGLDLTRDRSMRLSINYRRGPRAAGWIMAIIGYGMMIGSIAVLDTDNIAPSIVLLSAGAVLGFTGQLMAMLIKPVGVVEF